MDFDSWALTLAVFLPAVGVIVMLAIPRQQELALKVTALATGLATLGVGIYLLAAFDYDRAGELQFVVDKSWIDVIHSRYILGLDGISLPLIVLSMVIVVLCVVYSWDHIPEPGNAKAFFILILVLEIGMNGTFVAQDLILFFVFFEVVLLPMYFMIGVWGGEQRQYAAIKFFLFTLFGSALMLLSFLALFFKTGAESFSIEFLAANADVITHSTQLLIFGGLFMGFAIKVPMFPFHTWLPDAHTQAPTVGSVILAAILLKLGTYGFIRIAIPVLPDAAISWAPWIGLLAVIGIIYGALCCLGQTDMKRLIAFSSVSHMGFVMLGIATLTSFGLNAAVFGMVAHGLITGMLFFLAGSVKERYHTLEIRKMSGLLQRIPRFGWILGFCAMASLGLPGLAGFWGEFPAILSAYQPAAGLSEEVFRTYMVIAAIGTVLAAAYLLWMYQRASFGDVSETFAHEPAHDVTLPEWIAWTPLLIGIVLFGIFPNLIFGMTDAAVDNALARSGAEPVHLLAQADGWVQPNIDYHALAPEIVLAGAIVVLLLVDLLLDERQKWATSSLAGIGLLAAFIPILTLAVDGETRVMFGGAYVVDDFSLVLKALFLLSAYAVVLISTNYVDEGDYYEGEYYTLLLCSVLGMLMISSSRDLVSLFIALELLSIPAYMLAAWRKRDVKSNEAGMKYFLLGVFASAVMLYGMSLLYGVTGSTLLSSIGAELGGSPTAQPIATLAIVFVIVGFAFKVSAVPFHSWAPDTYEGAPTPVTAFLSVASKAAGFVALLTLVFIGFLGESDVWQPVFWVLAALSMTVGNLVALRQTNMVRMLAYSSIAQGGFILMPLAVIGDSPEAAQSALTAVITYLVIYAVMNIGAFAVVIAVARKTRSGEISSYGGLFSYAPALCVAMTFFLFSLAGTPPLGGWVAKFVVFRSLLDAGGGWAVGLAVIGVVNSVIALFYYAAVSKEMWMNPAPDGDVRPIRIPAPLLVAVSGAAVLIVLVGIFPSIVLHFTDLTSLVALGS